MKIINVLWSGGNEYASIHNVHEQILSLSKDKSETWLLQGSLGVAGANILEWSLPRRLLKGRGPWSFLLFILRIRLRKQLLCSRATLVILDGIGAARVILPVLRRLPGIRALVLFHGHTRWRESDFRLFEGYSERQVELVAVSGSLGEYIQDNLQRPVTSLRTAINPENFKARLYDREQARALLGIDQDGRIICGVVGRLATEKGHSILLDMFSKLVCNRPNIHLILLGEGEQRQALEAQIRRLDLQDHVTLAGYQAEAGRMYRAFDLLLVPSRHEGLGLVIQEGVLAQVPVVTSALPVFVEQLGQAGIYAGMENVTEWVAAVERVLESDRVSLALKQYRQLAPEKSWKEFSQGYSRLLDGSSHD